MAFNYKQKIHAETEYLEALALYLYCQCNNLDFDKEMRKRDPKKLKVFPDFILDDCILEVTRSLDKVAGKQQKDIVSVFGQTNAAEAINNKNKELLNYKDENSHQIEFKEINGVAYAATELKNKKLIIKDIEDQITKKSKNNNVIENKNTLDLFVINYEEIDKENISDLFLWYKESQINSFRNIYIYYLSNGNNFYNVLIMNKKQITTKTIENLISKNDLCKLIFDLGWLDEKKYSK